MPVIASDGAGAPDHLTDAMQAGANAALAAILHYGREAKAHLAADSVAVRP